MKRGADAPEVETVETRPADRPQSLADAGKRGGGASGDIVGDKVETEWRQTLSIPSLGPHFPSRRPTGAAPFAPATGMHLLKIRANDALAPAAYRRSVGAFPVMAHETEPEPTGTPSLPAGTLKHPTFDRPPVVNIRRPGRKAGTVSLDSARRAARRAKESAVWDKAMQPVWELLDDMAAGKWPGDDKPQASSTPPMSKGDAKSDPPLLRKPNGKPVAASVLASSLGAKRQEAKRQEAKRRAATVEASKAPQAPAHDVFAKAGARIAPSAGRSKDPGLFAPADAAVIRSALSILASGLREPGAVLNAPGAVREFLALHLVPLDHEVFGVVFLDSRHAVITFEPMFRGTLTQTSVYPREVVKRAMHHNAAAVILAHNHPSGVPEPSRSDEVLTQTLKAALALIDVRVLDHFVVGGMSMVSMAERGLM